MGENGTDWKNIIVAMALALLVVFAYDQFYYQPKLEEFQKREAERLAANPESQNVPTGSQNAPEPGSMAEFADSASSETSPEAFGEASTTATAPALAAARNPADIPRVSISNDELSGSIALVGARFDDINLINHKVELDGEETVQLLENAHKENGFYVHFGWIAKTKPQDFVPGPGAIWTADRKALTPGQTVTLTWDNGYGVIFEQRISMDDRFLFTVSQAVQNNTDEPLNIQPYGQIMRKGIVKTEGIFVLHEGPFGVFNGTLEESTYDDLRDEPFEAQSLIGGWLGITDKFWMTTLIPNQNDSLARARLMVNDRPTGRVTRAFYTKTVTSVPAGQASESESHFYAGAKEVSAIDDYAEQLNIAMFDRAIDWGWFYFLTRPLFYLLHLIFGFVGNFGVAIILLTILVKAALYPLANKSYVSMAHMKKAAPKIKALQERYKDDRAKQQQEMMALYQKEKINPLAGCLPMLLQIPVFFALYKVLYVTIDMRHQPFFGWIKDLSAPDPLTPVNLFGLIPWDPPSMIAIGVWPILMGLTMWLQQKANPQQNMDPTQAKILSFLPIIFTFILAGFSAGLVIYWTLNSALSVAQQYYIMKREEKREAIAAAATAASKKS